MKSKTIIVAGLLLALPLAVQAQKHIQQAFDALLQSNNQREVASQRSLERDPETGKKEGESDVYDFQLTTSSARKLVTDIEKAFERDRDAAYSVKTGTYAGSYNYVRLAVGDGSSSGVAVGKMKGSRYIYACFLDPADSEKKYRYAYALEWVEKGDKITGRIVKTYATTQKYRESNTSRRHIISINGNTMQLTGEDGSLSFDMQKSSETWLAEFNTFKNLFLKHPNSTAANSYATQIYKLCKDASPLEDVEKNIIAAEITKLKAKTNDEFVQQLFDMSIERLKK